MVAVNSTVQDRVSLITPFVEEMGLTFPILLDHDGAVTERYMLQSFPSTYFIDRRGIIRDVTIGGPMREEIIAEKIAPLLAQRP